MAVHRPVATAAPARIAACSTCTPTKRKQACELCSCLQWLHSFARARQLSSFLSLLSLHQSSGSCSTTTPAPERVLLLSFMDVSSFASHPVHFEFFIFVPSSKFG